METNITLMMSIVFMMYKQYHHTCIVDEQNAKHLRPEIKQIPIEDPEGHWEKIKMFKNDWVGDYFT